MIGEKNTSQQRDLTQQYAFRGLDALAHNSWLVLTACVLRVKNYVPTLVATETQRKSCLLEILAGVITHGLLDNSPSDDLPSERETSSEPVNGRSFQPWFEQGCVGLEVLTHPGFQQSFMEWWWHQSSIITSIAYNGWWESDKTPHQG